VSIATPGGDPDFGRFCDRARQVAVDLAHARKCHVARVDLKDLSQRGSSGEYVPWEQTVWLDRQQVGAYLVDLLEQRLPATDVEQAYDAVATFYHEHVHALGPPLPGINHGFNKLLDAEARRPINRGPRNIEEAVTESWTALTLTDFMSRTGLSGLEPRLVHCEFANKYPVLCEILRPVADYLAGLTDTSVEVVLRVMAAEMPDTRSSRVATWIGQRRGWGNDAGADETMESIAQLFDSFLDHRLIVSGANHGAFLVKALQNVVRQFEG
jgi:hypothetical protein